MVSRPTLLFTLSSSKHCMLLCASETKDSEVIAFTGHIYNRLYSQNFIKLI